MAWTLLPLALLTLLPLALLLLKKAQPLLKALFSKLLNPHLC